MLNDPDPEENIRLRLENPRLKKKEKEKLEYYLRHEYQKALEAGVPVGTMLRNCRTEEDAYLVRQRYINRITAQNDFNHTLTILVLLVLFGLALSFFIWLFYF